MEIIIDEHGWLFIDGVRICIVEEDSIKFHDRNHFRSEKRGTDQLEVRFDEFIHAIRSKGLDKLQE